MKKFSPLLLLIAILLVSCTQQKWNYPKTRKTDQVDDYFGTQVPDPYRWLENDTSAETARWVQAENELTFSYLEKIPYRDKIRARLSEIWNYERKSSPWWAGGHYFFTRNDGLQNQSVYYMMESPDSAATVVLDPNKLSEDGTVALTNFSVSKDGKKLAYGISRGGSDWREFMVKDLETGEDLSDHLRWIKFSGIAWYHDGFFYSRFDEPRPGKELSAENVNNKVFYHRIGTSQSQDQLIYADPDHPGWSFYPSVTDDEQFLVISVTESTSGNALYVKDLSQPNADFVKLTESFENDHYLVDHREGKFFIMTNMNAPMYKLVSLDDQEKTLDKIVDVIPEHSDEVLTDITFGGGRVIAGYLKDAHDVYRVYDLDGKKLYDIELPAIGSVGGFNARYEDNTAFYTFTSFTFPSVVYRYDIETNQSTEWFKPNIDFDFDQYTTRQVFYTSKDGTRIPMFLVHRTDLETNGKNPTLLYGYGGFNISLTPSFSITRLFWLENGGVFALANLRGGGEYGEKWHQAGTKMNKQNVFDDFIYAAKYLINENITSPEYLACQGGSNGGLLIGAVINQAPELFKVALPAVGVMDMLRYHKFTIGKYWASDYGTSEDSPEMFEYLYSYSPLHNIRSGVNYPAVLITTADHDDRVVPAHSFKYAATLQEKYKGPNPVLIRVETQAGHGGGKPTAKRIEEATDMYAFIMYNMGIEPK